MSSGVGVERVAQVFDETGDVQRAVLRFGQRMDGSAVPTVPERFRGGPSGPSGRLVAARMLPERAEAWLRLRPSTLPWQRDVRTVPASASQSPAPTPDSLEVHGGMTVRCHEGAVGKLEGITLDRRTGRVLGMLLRIRSDVLAAVESAATPLAKLLPLQGQAVLLPPGWIVSASADASHHEHDGVEQAAHPDDLTLNATVEQVASGDILRPDGDLAGDLNALLADNPALAPYAGNIQIAVHDGEVTLRGTLPTIRHRATLEQEVWHVPGVLAYHNRVTVG